MQFNFDVTYSYKIILYYIFFASYINFIQYFWNIFKTLPWLSLREQTSLRICELLRNIDIDLQCDRYYYTLNLKCIAYCYIGNRIKENKKNVSTFATIYRYKWHTFYNISFFFLNIYATWLNLLYYLSIDSVYHERLSVKGKVKS